MLPFARGKNHTHRLAQGHIVVLQRLRPRLRIEVRCKLELERLEEQTHHGEHLALREALADAVRRAERERDERCEVVALELRVGEPPLRQELVGTGVKVVGVAVQGVGRSGDARAFWDEPEGSGGLTPVKRLLKVKYDTVKYDTYFPPIILPS